MIALVSTSLRLLAGAAALVALVAREPAHAQDFDVNAVFWCDAARDATQPPAECTATREVILQVCTSCHTFVPIVKSQKSAEEWGAMLGAHREKVSDVADDDIARIQKFLAVRFNPQTPPPKLPPELDALGTQQAN